MQQELLKSLITRVSRMKLMSQRHDPKETIMPKGYHHVPRDERCQIYALKSIGLPLGKIALSIERSVIAAQKIP